jgi:hypothetical protein
MCSRGFSLDEQPGQTVLEFRFPILEEESFSAFELHRDRFGEAPNPEFDEIVLRFALVLKDVKISEIRIPSKVTQSIQQLVNEN